MWGAHKTKEKNENESVTGVPKRTKQKRPLPSFESGLANKLIFLFGCGAML